ncbi:MAG: superoxide dismutase [Bacteroidetes bacterium]|nr:superoxide dismutase [Bacteroidota bacterium]
MKKDSQQNGRRDFLKKSALLAAAGLASGSILTGVASAKNIPGEILPANTEGKFSLPALPYAYDALEPHIDKTTMEIHHTKHHQAYVNNLNKACEEGKIDASLDDIIKNISKYPMAVRNNGGGHWNHSFFWKLMKANGGGAPSGKVAEAINGSFGSFDEMKNKFNDAAKSRFGSGWAWLIDKNGKLEIGSTPNQDNPLMDISDLKGKPILSVDVWEHAYYLKYQNKRADYVTAWWNLVNWEEVAKNL